MKEDKFYELMGEIDPEIIAAADKPVPFRQKRGFKIMLIAAVLALVMLITPVAGAFALAVGYIATRDDVNDGSEPQDPTQGDTEQNYALGGLVGELFGGIDWGGIKDAIGKDGNIEWGAIFDVLQDTDKRPKVREGAFTASVQEDGTVSIIRYKATNNETVVEIPEKIAGRTVTAIGREAFYENENITHVSLPDTVTVIEEFAFHGCTNLLTVDLKENVHRIGCYAFGQCTSLTGITLPSSLVTLEESAFWKCTALTEVTIPASLKNWEHNTFIFSGLQKVTIMEGVTEIPRDTFGYTNITEIEIPSSVTTIGIRAFGNCESLKKITLNEGLELIESEAFNNTAIRSLTIPSTVTEIGNIDFYQCLNLEYVIFLGDAPTIGSVENYGKYQEPDYTVYYRSDAHGFVGYAWDTQRPCKPIEADAEELVAKAARQLVPIQNVQMLGAIDSFSTENAVTVIDSYALYKNYADGLTTERYEKEYFNDSAIVLIKVKHSSNEKVLGLAGLVPELYTTGGVYYLALNPIVIMDSPKDHVDGLHDFFILAEVKRSDIRTDDVVRVGTVYAFDITNHGGSVYHPGFVEEKGK